MECNPALGNQESSNPRGPPEPPAAAAAAEGRHHSACQLHTAHDNMGLDGGTRITRSDVLRRQSSRWAQQDTSRSTRGGSVSQVYQEKQIDDQVRRTVLWTTCALSGLPLTPPIVADALGQLFNKQAVLEHLLAAKAAAAAAECPTAALPHTQSTPALPAPAAPGAVVTLSAKPATSKATGSIVPYMPPAGVPQDLAAACLRYENQQRAAAAAAAASDGIVTLAGGTFDHIKSLKDVFIVQLTVNPACAGSCAGMAIVPAHAAAQQGQTQQETLSATTGHLQMSSRQDYSGQDLPSPWICPITLQPCGGSKQPFMALKPCGHVLSQKALDAITPTGKQKSGKANGTAAASSGSNQPTQDALLGEGAEECELQAGQQAYCPVCEAPFDPKSDQVLTNGSQQHMEEARVQLQEAAAAKAQAKDKKKRKRAAAEA